MAFELDVNLPPTLAPLAWLVGRWEGAGVVERYDGRRDPAKPSVQLRTDGVRRSPAAKEYNAGSRMYGLKDSWLLWVMDMAAVGQGLQSHVSAQLKRVG
ncbi:MAG: heme-binding beta-barrel domain-containing protein [Dermatophilaceae bacterium]